LRTAPDGQPGPPAGREGFALPADLRRRCCSSPLASGSMARLELSRRRVNEQRRNAAPAKARPAGSPQGNDPRPTRLAFIKAPGKLLSARPDTCAIGLCAELASFARTRCRPSPSASLKPCWRQELGERLPPHRFDLEEQTARLLPGLAQVPPSQPAQAAARWFQGLQRPAWSGLFRSIPGGDC